LTPSGVFDSGPGGILLVGFFVYLLYLLLRDPFTYLANKCCKQLLLEDLEIDEDIDTYANCLDEDDKTWTTKEEENCMQYGMPTMLHDQLEAI